MTSPVCNDYYWDSIKIKGLSESYYKIKETPLSSVISYYYDISEPVCERDRIFQSYWLIKDNILYFEYEKRICDDKRYYFHQICKQNTNVNYDPIIAKWFTGKIKVQIEYRWGYIDEHGSFPDISTHRNYVICNGIVTKMVEECEFHDAVPF